MNSKIMIAATVAALSLTTAAFAGEGKGDPFPFHAQFAAPARTSAYPADTGSNAYPAPNQALSFPQTGEALLPSYGSEGAVQTANSLPANFEVGTVAYAQAQSVKRWFAQQDTNRRFAQMHQARPNG
jgi:hypothetical protein